MSLLPLQLEIIRAPEAFEALRDEWNALLPHNATNEVFLTWQWQRTWWDAYRPGDLWIVTARTAEGALVGVAPWFLHQPERVIRPIGCVEVTDYLDVLVLPDHREAFYTALASCLADHRDEYSRVNLCNHPTGSPTLDLLPRALTERGFSVHVREQEVCPIIRLPETFDKYLESLDKKQRHELRRKLRRAEGGDDQVGWYIVGPEHDLNAEIEKFTRLMAASQVNKAQFLQDEQNAAFFRAMVPVVAACGWLQLSFLTVNGEPAATYMNFDYDNRVLVYNSGLLPEKFSYLSPGIVLLLHIIEDAIGKGRAEMDFLRGNEDYKYRLGGQDRAVMEIQAS